MWLNIQIVVSLVCVSCTLHCFYTKRIDAVAGIFFATGLYLMLFSPLLLIFLALLQDSFWRSVLLGFCVWMLLTWYLSALGQRTSPDNPGWIIIVLPMFIWMFGLPLAILIHLLMTWLGR